MLLRPSIRSLGCILAIFTLVLSPEFRAHAQVATADVLGTVTDSSGAAVSGATVTLKNQGTGVATAATSNGAGDYVFNLLIPGHYVVSVEASGFKKFVVSDINLAAGDRLRADAKLQPGSVQETVEVTAAPSLLETDSSSVSSVVTEQSVQDLPLNGRNFVNLVQLQPGVNEGQPDAISSGQRPDDRRVTSTVVANGQPDEYNSEMIDGMDNNEREQGFIGVRPSIDAIAEVKVDTNDASADIGRAAGAVVNIITKSGTNALHGSLYEYFRNDVFDARDFFETTGVTPKPEYRQNQFGGSVGGPIIRNKTFFFGDVEDNRVIQGISSGLLTVPTLFEEQNPGNFTDVGLPDYPSFFLNPIGLAYFSMYPAPNVPGAGPFNNFTSVVNKQQTTLSADGRIDHHFNSNNALFGRYSYNDVHTDIPGYLSSITVGGLKVQPNGCLFCYAGTSVTKAHGVQFNYVHVFTPNLLLELKTGYTRIDIESRSLNDGLNVANAIGLPNVNLPSVPNTTGFTPLYFLDGNIAELGDSPFLPILNRNNTFQYIGAVTYTHGKHNVKMGSQLIRRQLNYFQNPIGLGVFFILGITGDPFSDVLLNAALGYERDNILTEVGARAWESGTYIQDDWRVTDSLTVNLGLRYDIYTPFTEAHGKSANFDYQTLSLITSEQDPHLGVHTSGTNFAPRLGFAKTINQKTVLRGGYGISYYPSALNGQITPLSPLYSYSHECLPCFSAPGVLNGFNLPVPTPSSTTNLSGSFTSLAPNANTSYVHEFNLMLQREFGANVVSVAGVEELGRRMLFSPVFNVPDPTGPYPNDATQGPGPTPPLLTATTLPNVGSITAALANATSNYSALQATFARRFTKGLAFNLNYTLAHGLTDASNSGTGATSSVGLLPRTPGYDYGNSQVDIRNRIAATLDYRLPFAAGATGAKGVFVKGWEVNSIVFWQTGSTFTVGDSFSNPNGVAQINLPLATDDRPNVTGQSYKASNQTNANWLNLNAWTPQPAGTPGDELNEAYYGPHTRRADLSLFKEFPLGETRVLQFRAECFNISNTPNFSNPNSTISGWTAGPEHTPSTPISAVGLLPGDMPTNAGGFGSITSTVPNINPRQFQFALKLLF
jgi:hypothetical protein